MSASSSGSSTALRSHEGSKPAADVASTLNVTIPPSALSARLAIAGKALKICARVAFKEKRTDLVDRASGAPGAVGALPAAMAGMGAAAADVGMPDPLGTVPGELGDAGTASGTMRKPESRSTSSSPSRRPSTTFSGPTWNFPSAPRAGGEPLVWAKIRSSTPRAMAFFSASADSSRGGQDRGKTTPRLPRRAHRGAALRQPPWPRPTALDRRSCAG